MFSSNGNGNHTQQHRRWARGAGLYRLLPRAFRQSLSVAILVTLASLVLVGCDNPFADSKDAPLRIKVAGEWTLEESWGTERWTISNDSIHYESSSDGETFSTTYRADIVSYSNRVLNAGDTALTSGREVTTRPGFAVIKYTEVNNAGTGEDGKFNVFRWATNNDDSALRDFTQGQKDATPEDEGYVNKVFATAAEAEEGATNAEGYFGFASAGAGR